ncbi:MAG: phenylacetic acid degradation protein [Chloroflexi bacterium]|nr:phenylacetic acid degradation protein [Chloroflexota bacterium]MCI0577502.1 phenylacetic acid degradation protein [Chloroflexota bacterium]MCI0645660.1 phenylacetic acid degradation protein [Chloroflexota bacterium]MCI0725572.1 phenylacetic acid degradation protein [Chloroflexota bacterium]
MDTQWPRFEVFQQEREGRPHQNIGSVHAPDAEIALQNARDVFARRPSTVNLWVVPAELILAKTAQELAENPNWREEAATPAGPAARYYVFQKQSQRRAMTYVSHVGEVEATSPAGALARALEQYGSSSVYVWWVFPAGAIVRTGPDEIGSLFAPAYDKSYRSPREYHTLTLMQEARQDS